MEWWPESLLNWILIISGIATTGIVLLVWRQFALTKKEMEYRLRPWVSPTTLKTSHVIFQDKTNERYDKFMNDPNKFRVPSFIQYNITIQNTGTLPAKKITKKFLLQKEKFSRDKLNTISDEKDTFSLMPGSTQNILCQCPYKEIKAGEIFYIGLALEYEIDKNNKGNSGKIYENSKLHYEVLEDWLE